MNFTLRPLRLSDVPTFAGHANNLQVARFMTDLFPYPYTEDDAIEFINKQLKNDPLNVLGIAVEGEAVGAIGIHPQSDIMRKNAELGYWLAEPFWGNGIISRAIPQMVDYGFKHWDIRRIFATPYGNNKASQRVLEKSGFVLEGILPKTIFKLDEYLDEYIYAIVRKD